MDSSDFQEVPTWEPMAEPEPRVSWLGYAPKYRRAFSTGLKLTATCFVLTLLTLDSGQLHRAFWVAMLAQWSTVGMVVSRRPLNPTWWDLAIVRYGIVLMLVIVVTFGPMLLRVIGIPSTHIP